MTSFPGDCAECGKPLNSYDIQHGWLQSDLGYRRAPARVHTVCIAKFERRTLEERRRLAKKVEA